MTKKLAHKRIKNLREAWKWNLMFSRSEELYGMKYGNYIGDGDSKTFTAVVNLNLYGDKLTVVKNECIEHVQKRIGTRLRNIRKVEKLDEKGKLTKALVNKLARITA